MLAYQRTLQDETGDIVPLAEVEVRTESGALASIFSDEAGTTPIVQPFNTTTAGLLSFYADQGVYDITVNHGGAERTFRADLFSIARSSPVYASHAAFSAAYVPAPVVAWSILSGGHKLGFVRDSDGTACVSANGVKGSPAGQAYVDHFGTNATPGTTDMRAAINAALSWGDAWLIPGVDYRVTMSSTTGITLPAGRTLHLNGARIIGHSSLTYSRLIDELGGSVIGPGTLEVGSSGGDMALIGTAGDGHKYIGVRFVGGTVYTTGTANWNSYGVQLLNGTGSNSDWTITGCEFTGLSFPLLKSNSQTSSHIKFRVSGCDFHGNYREDLSFNSPAGPMSDVRVWDNTFRDNKGVDEGIDAIHLAFASIKDFSAYENRFSGEIREAIHVEEACDGFSIYRNDIECDFSGISSGIALLHADANETGTRSIPKNGTIHSNVIRKDGTQKVSETYGIFVVNNTESYASAENVRIFGNLLQGFGVGLQYNAAFDKGNAVYDNTAKGCATGFVSTATGTLSGEIAGFYENRSVLCDTGVGAKNGAIFDRHTFDRCTTAASATTHFVTLLDPTFLLPVVSTISGNTDALLFPLTANSMVYGDAYLLAKTAANPHWAQRVALISWDGTTWASPTYKATVSPGSVVVQANLASNALQFRVFDTAVRADCYRRLSLTGVMVLRA